MKIKPWLGPKEVLEGFYVAMRSNAQDGAFWTELEELLHDLSADMVERVKMRGLAIENELLDSSTHAALLDEIREKIAGQSFSYHGLHELSRQMCRPAASLLLMLAAAIVVGCAGEVATDNNSTTTSGGTSGYTSAGGASSSFHGGASSGGASGITFNVGGQGGIGSLPTGGTANYDPFNLCPNPSAPSGLDIENFANCNQELVNALIPYDIHNRDGKQLLECACLLNDSWQTGLADLFAGQDCKQIADYFGCCGLSKVCSKDSANLPAQFDADLLIDNSCCLVYLGVRCD